MAVECGLNHPPMPHLKLAFAGQQSFSQLHLGCIMALLANGRRPKSLADAAHMLPRLANSCAGKRDFDTGRQVFWGIASGSSPLSPTISFQALAKSPEHEGLHCPGWPGSPLEEHDEEIINMDNYRLPVLWQAAANRLRRTFEVRSRVDCELKLRSVHFSPEVRRVCLALRQSHYP